MKPFIRILPFVLFSAIILVGNMTDSFAQTCPAPEITYCGLGTNCEGDSVIANAPPSYGHVTTFTGTAYGNINGPMLFAEFHQPNALAFDANGNLFVGEALNNCVRKITPSGMVSTYAGSPFSYA
ncbi:MAG: hypothetical protein V4543_01435, partial [Bacteroidota bacterium]